MWWIAALSFPYTSLNRNHRNIATWDICVSCALRAKSTKRRGGWHSYCTFWRPSERCHDAKCLCHASISHATGFKLIWWRSRTSVMVGDAELSISAKPVHIVPATEVSSGFSIRLHVDPPVSQMPIRPSIPGHFDDLVLMQKPLRSVPGDWQPDPNISSSSNDSIPQDWIIDLAKNCSAPCGWMSSGWANWIHIFGTYLVFRPSERSNLSRTQDCLPRGRHHRMERRSHSTVAAPSGSPRTCVPWPGTAGH